MGNRIIVSVISIVMVLMVVSVGDPVASVPEMDTDLGDSNASFWGEDVGDSAGYPVASIGDVNGDGYDDILIGARNDDDGGSNAGQTYLILGKASGWSMDMKLSNADASFLGENANDSAGLSLAGAGDVNGDGYDDILIGARRNNDNGVYAGKTYLVLGRASGWSMDMDLSNADASFWGEDKWDFAGWSVAGAGDVNSDGYDDILIGARGADSGGSYAGQTYLILGKASGWSMDTDLSNVDASFFGEDSHDYSGSCVAGIGDVNGDGYDDILIGAYGSDDSGEEAGQVYLILGKASGWTMYTNLSNADASFLGENDWDNACNAARAGDVNGDGYDDILIGASSNDDGGIWAGQTYLIFGKTSGWEMDTKLSNADASFWGEHNYDRSGQSVAGAGDVNGDGYDDILIGAPYNEEKGYVVGLLSKVGQTYLILGKASGWAMDIALSNADASFWGEGSNDNSGSSVAGGGDVNGDGYDDILIGASGNSEGGDGTGQTYLIFVTLDRDDDGVPDGNDAFPDDVAASLDSDEDGYPDEWNTGRTHSDSTTGLRLDAFSDDYAASLDMDGDGFPDEWNLGMSADDSISDPKLMLDEFPNDPLEWVDTDGDGHGDNGDAFPDDPLEWLDTDGDDHGDNGDVFPDDPLEWADKDEDGYGDNGDAFPNDPLEWLDTDVDTHGDNGDVFPNDPLEWLDSDDDGIGDNGDAFPDDAAASVDTDGDGHPDEWNSGMTNEDSTTGLKLDHYPQNADKWKEEETPALGGVFVLLAMLVGMAATMMRRKG